MRLSKELPEELVIETLILIKPRLDQLNPGDQTEAKHLFDPDDWNSMERTVKRFFGSVITIMAEMGRIPLRVLKTDDGHKIFTPDRHNLFVKTKGKVEAGHEED